MKTKILVLLGLLTVGSLVIVFLSSQRLKGTNGELDKERYDRMVAEEKLEQALSKIKSLEGNVSASSNQLQAIKEALEQQKNNNASVREELEKMTKLKEVLEQELKNSLVPTPPASPARGQ